jgi:hypothetical protein
MREKLLIGQKTDNEEQCKDAKIALAMRQVEYKDAIIVLAAKQENARLHVSVVLVSMQRCHHCFGWTETTLQRHCTENSKQIFPEKELRGLVPLLLHIFPRSVHLFCYKTGRPIVGICKSLTDT